MGSQVGVACAGKREQRSLSFRIGLTQYGKLLREEGSMCQLPGKARPAQSHFCPDCLSPLLSLLRPWATQCCCCLGNTSQSLQWW